MKNTIAGIAAAKAWGIENPSVGLLNLDGARTALGRLKKLRSAGWNFELTASVRGEELLRGNDILGGTVDVLVCDSLSGNAFIKLLGGYSSGGRLEVSGSGYGPGLGGGGPLVNIISRASSAAVAANALIYSAKMAEAGLGKIYDLELEAAAAAGFSEPEMKTGGPDLKPKTVNHEIEGVDVLALDDAVKRLKADGIYCEAGMGCTGPVVMVAAEDAGKAETLLAENGFIQ